MDCKLRHQGYSSSAYADDIVLLGDNEDILRANTHTLLSNTKELGLEVNIKKTQLCS